MTINKIIIISSIVPVIQHGRQGLCRLNLTGMVANHLFESIHNFLRSKQVILSLTLKERAIHVYLARLLLQNSSIDNFFRSKRVTFFAHAFKNELYMYIWLVCC